MWLLKWLLLTGSLGGRWGNTSQLARAIPSEGRPSPVCRLGGGNSRGQSCLCDCRWGPETLLCPVSISATYRLLEVDIPPLDILSSMLMTCLRLKCKDLWGGSHTQRAPKHNPFYSASKISFTNFTTKYFRLTRGKGPHITFYVPPLRVWYPQNPSPHPWVEESSDSFRAAIDTPWFSDRESLAGNARSLLLSSGSLLVLLGEASPHPPQCGWQ